MKSLLIGLLALFPWPLLAQTAIKENLGPTVNTVDDQILPVFSLDGQTLYFSENGTNGRYEIWFSQRDPEGNWLPRQKAANLNPPTTGSKYVFAEAEKDLLLVNGRFEPTNSGWEQSKGLSWYIPSQDRYIRLYIPELQTQARGRFVNAFLDRHSKTLLLSYAEDERKNIYVCQPKNPEASWTDLHWQPPVRLPAPLNSDFDDTTPFLDSDGRTLYFSSNRPGGYGQDDIYRSRRLDDSWIRWSAPENLGFGVNSNFSEIYFCISPSRDFQYFVSYKHSFGSGDIFRLVTDSTQRAIEPELEQEQPVADAEQIPTASEAERADPIAEVEPRASEPNSEPNPTPEPERPAPVAEAEQRNPTPNPASTTPTSEPEQPDPISEVEQRTRDANVDAITPATEPAQADLVAEAEQRRSTTNSGESTPEPEQPNPIAESEQRASDPAPTATAPIEESEPRTPDPVTPSHNNGAEVTELAVDQYKPNNLVFLIDRSGSMQPWHKLQLLKFSLKRLIGELRDIDRLTLMSFADSAVIHFSSDGVTRKDSLYYIIDRFTADGNTRANQGLQLAYDYTGRNFIAEGNNEIILVTDGQFDLSEKDRQRIDNNDHIVFSVVGLGSDSKALANLRALAESANGSFIRIRNAEIGTEALLEEVKARSRL